MSAPPTASDVLESLREEWEALGLMSYHGVVSPSRPAVWRADLAPVDIGKIRALIALAAHQLEGLESVRRCNDPMPTGDGMQLCDLWPDHEGPHVNAADSYEWRNRG